MGSLQKQILSFCCIMTKTKYHIHYTRNEMIQIKLAVISPHVHITDPRYSTTVSICMSIVA